MVLQESWIGSSPNIPGSLSVSLNWLSSSVFAHVTLFSPCDIMTKGQAVLVTSEEKKDRRSEATEIKAWTVAPKDGVIASIRLLYQNIYVQDRLQFCHKITICGSGENITVYTSFRKHKGLNNNRPKTKKKASIGLRKHTHTE